MTDKLRDKKKKGNGLEGGFEEVELDLKISGGAEGEREICEARIGSPWLQRLGGDQPTEADEFKKYVAITKTAS